MDTKSKFCLLIKETCKGDECIAWNEINDKVGHTCDYFYNIAAIAVIKERVMQM